MPRNITITFSDGSGHRYENIPDNVTPDMIEARVQKDFPGKRITNIDGGKKSNQHDSQVSSKSSNSPEKGSARANSDLLADSIYYMVFVKDYRPNIVMKTIDMTARSDSLNHAMKVLANEAYAAKRSGMALSKQGYRDFVWVVIFNMGQPK